MKKSSELRKQVSAALGNWLALSHKIASPHDIIPLVTGSARLANDFVTLANEETVVGMRVTQQG